MKLFVTEFAENKKEIERSLKPLTEKIIEHLFKLYLLPNNESVKHWKKEIYSFIHSIDKLKGSNKRPTSKQIYEWTFGKKADIFDDDYYVEVMVDTIEYEYSTTIGKNVNSIKNDMYVLCDNYFKWLSNELSVKGLISPQSVYAELDNLL